MDDRIPHAALLDALFRRNPAVVGVFLRRGGAVEVVAVNDALARATGWDQGEVRGRDLGELLPAPVVATVLAAHDRALGSVGQASFETAVPVPDGRRVFEVTLTDLGAVDDGRWFVTVNHDVTVERHTVAALDETQRLARIGHWSWEVADDVVLWTPTLYEIYGLEPEDFEPTFEGWLRHLHPDDVPVIREVVERSMAGGGSYERDIRVLRADGEQRTVVARGRVVRDDDGRPVRLVGTAQDVTEHRAAELAARAFAVAQLRQAQALELNDNVVQGLATARLAMMEGDADLAMDVLDRTMEAARSIISGLLASRPAGPQPGDLVRSSSARPGREDAG